MLTVPFGGTPGLRAFVDNETIFLQNRSMPYPTLSLFIDGRWLDRTDSGTLPVLNPADGTVLGQLPIAGPAEVEAAAAAAAAAQRDLADGMAEKLASLRNRLRMRLEDADGNTMFPGRDSDCLPNTLSILTPGWRGETQVMQMDLAGFAISAGSACSSGKVRASGVLQAMGFDDKAAQSAIRISISPALGDDQVNRFADAWESAYRRWRERNG